MTPQLRHPHITGRVELYKGELAFPLRAAYDNARSTLNGIRRDAERRGALVPLDPQHDKAEDTASDDVAPPSATRSAGAPMTHNEDDSATRGADVPPLPAPPPDKADADGIYRDAAGRLYKRDTAGRRYNVDETGTRIYKYADGRVTSRPPGCLLYTSPSPRD